MIFSLTEREQTTLLQVARESILARLENRIYVLPEATSALRQRGSAFVSLHLDGALRGCIGDLEFQRPLIESVQENAKAAAFRDPRFPALVLEELARVEIEISCLSLPVAIEDPHEIEVGRHGVILQKSNHRAVFLPQVATEYGWDVQTTLEHLSRKAGLSTDAWQEGASFQVFEAIVFGESHAG